MYKNAEKLNVSSSLISINFISEATIEKEHLF